METNYPLVDRVYKHYKGGLYRVISLATHTSSDEQLVVYKSLGFGSVYARPLKEWFETIRLSGDNESLVQVLRFRIYEGA